MMESFMAAITALNLVLCAIIFLLGLYVYASRRSQLALLVAASFGLFGVSHVITLLGMAASLDLLLVIIRAAAYALIIVALCAEVWVSAKAVAPKPAPRRRR